MPDRTPCQLYLDPRGCARPGKDRTGAPVRIECVTEDGEAFTVCVPRPSWARLLLGDREVPGWIEPLALDQPPVESA